MINKITVIGDSMLDKYVYGDITRLNPEEHWAPLMKVEREEYRLGWAANVAANIKNLWIETQLLGVLWCDTEAMIMKDKLHSLGISDFFVTHESPTIVKERYMYHGRQMLRVDKEKPWPLMADSVAQILRYIQDNITNIVVISDYGKWIANNDLINSIKKLAIKNDIKIIADIKPQNIDMFHDIYVIKPNFNEFRWMVWKPDMRPDDLIAIEKLWKNFAKKMNANIIITKGEYGATLCRPNGYVAHFPTISPKKVIDVTWAWDTFLATISYALSHNYTLEKAIELGNKASGVVIGKLGTSLVEKVDIL